MRSDVTVCCTALLLSLQGLAPAPPSQPRTPSLLIRGVTTIDVARGCRTASRTVRIEGNRIVGVGADARVGVPANARVLDGRGRFLIPGLWDMHVHTTGPRSDAMLPVYVAYGVTGVRDMGGDLEVLRRLRTAIADGARVGPRMVVAGPILDGPLRASMPAAHRRWRIEVTEAARARQLVDSLADGGADFIKVHERLSPSVHRAIAQQARRRGLAIAGHIPTAVGAPAAAMAGQRTVEHLVNVPLSCTAAEDAVLRSASRLERLFGVCAPGFAAAVDAFVKAGTSHTPTLVIQQRIALGAGAIRGDPGTRHVPVPVREMLDQVMPLDLPTQTAGARERLALLLAMRSRQVGTLHRAGVQLLVGTDSPGVAPGWSVHEEMRLLTSAGLSACEALAAATRNPAALLGATDSLGAITAGQRADLVLLDANPVADIRNTTRIAAVIANGRLLEREAIGRILRNAEQAAAIPDGARQR